MKLTAFLLTAACLQVAASGHSQSVTLSLKNAPLQQAFTEIKKQSGFSFLYNDKTLADAKKVSVQVSNVSLEEVLALCFTDQPLTYTIVDKTIVVKQKEATTPNEPATIPVNNEPPPIDISGKVTDKDGNPLAGASITVKGKAKLGAKTDAMGVFVLKGLEADDVITISYAEYISQDYKIGTTTNFLIKLLPSESALDEVIIKPYSGNTKRFDLGNSVQITSKEIEKSPVQNAMLALQGRVTGIDIIQKNGINGGGLDIKIQGQNSLNNSNDPFIVIDGIPFPSQNIGNTLTLEGGVTTITGDRGIILGGNPLNAINPNDIESITILKDADATSIYGSRAANGAILITTKKGKPGKPKLSINLQQGWGKVGHFVDMLNTRQYLDMRYEAYRNDGISISSLTPNISNYDLTFWDTTRYTNWQKVLIGGTAKFSNFRASLSGGSANMSYLIGATFNRTTTVFPGDFDDKTGNLHFNINGSSANQRLKLGLSGSYAYDDNHLPGIDLTRKAFLLEPVAPALYNSDGTLNWAIAPNGFSSWGTHPLAYIESSDLTNTTKNLFSSLNLTYEVLRGLHVKVSAGYTNTQNNLYRPQRLDIYEPRRRPTATRIAYFGARNMGGWNIEPQLSYNTTLSKGKLYALIGSTIQQDNYDYQEVQSSGFVSDLLMKSMKAATTNFISQSISGIRRFNAAFGTFNYNWDGKYILNFNVRRDGSNKFGPKARFNNFYSLAGGWIFTEEKWIKKKLSFLSFGKLRGSYGTTGNAGISDFIYLSIYNVNIPTILYQNSIGLFPLRLPNPYLQWEDTRKLNFGLELGVLKDKIRLDINYARNLSFNQLLGENLPTVTGFSSITRNQEFVVRNRSWEFIINTLNTKSKIFTWTTSLNLTLPKNEYANVPEYVNASVKKNIGNTLRYRLVSKYAGVNPADGSYLIVDRNGNLASVSTPDDANIAVPLGFPRFYGGISNSIQYKKFRIDFLIQFKRIITFNEMYFSNGVSIPGVFNAGTENNQPVSVMQRWQKPGDISPIGRFTTLGTANTVYTATDANYSYDASFVKLKNVSISWQLPDNWIKKAGLQRATLYTNAQNLFTLTKYRGFDPETGNNGLPPLRMITTGINVDF